MIALSDEKCQTVVTKDVFFLFSRVSELKLLVF